MTISPLKDRSTDEGANHCKALVGTGTATKDLNYG